jgi:hypothetical protein
MSSNLENMSNFNFAGAVLKMPSFAKHAILAKSTSYVSVSTYQKASLGDSRRKEKIGHL